MVDYIIMDELRLPTPLTVARSLPLKNKELSDYPNSTSPIDEDWSDGDHWEENEQRWLLNGSSYDSGHYGSSVPSTSEMSKRRNKKARGRRKSGEKESGVGTSISNLANRVSCI